MTHSRWNRAAGVVLIAVACWAAQAQQPPAQPHPAARRPPHGPPAREPPGTAPAGPGATGTTITIVMPDGSTRAQIVLAMPAPANLAALQGTAGNAARTLDQTLRKDLDKSGIFRLQEADELAVLTLTGDLAHDADQYRSLGAEMLLQNEIKQDGDRLVIEGRLIDLASRQPIVGKRYRGTFDLARRIAHTFADEIILYLTGKRGVALTSIAFSSDRDGEKEIYLMDYDGFDQRRITGHRSISLSPAWSPTGDVLSYVSFFGGEGPAIYLADILSGRKSPVVTSGSLNTSPTFSPDGRRLAFARGLGANIEIFTCRRDGSELRQLTSSPGIDTNPAWSPNGNEIAFTSSRSGSPQIYVVDAEGTNLRRVTFDGDYNDGASLEPGRHPHRLRHALAAEPLRSRPGRPRDSRHAAPDRRRRQQRDAGLLSGRTADRLQLDPRRGRPDLRDGGALRSACGAAHIRRRESRAGLVRIPSVSAIRGWIHACMC